jgi:cyclophilin family peptidyl-prolyl cis-trans isomerase
VRVRRIENGRTPEVLGMFERKVQGATGRVGFTRLGREAKPRRVVGPRVETLEGRALMATLAPIPAVPSPVNLGFQVPLNGGTGDNQTYTVTSDNPSIGATVAQGKFLTINVTHASSGAGDPAFTGTMVYQLFEDLTPNTVSQIETLVNQGFYTNKIWHRVAANFPGPTDYIVQGGSVNGNGTGDVNQPGFPFPDEFVQQLAFTDTGANNPAGVAGQLAMANSGSDTNGSQFFVTTGAPYFLDFKHTIFAQLVSGFETVDQMTKVAVGGTDGTTPVSPITMTSATLSNANPDGVIHIDTTQATVGQSAKVTVTAHDPTDNTSTSQTFTVNVVPSLNPTQPEKPFIGPNPVPNQVVGVVSGSGSTAQGQTSIFQIPAVAPTPGDPLTYTVKGGVTVSGSTKTFTPVQNATATVDSTGRVTVVPTAGFTGVINLLVGVRDNTNRAGTTSIDDPANYDTQTLTLTVNNGAVVNLVPIANSGTTNISGSGPTTVRLSGSTSNPQSSTQTLTYNLVSTPQHGTVSNFDSVNGTFTYTPNPDFSGNDTVNFTVTDTGAPNPSLTSAVATQTLAVGSGADTGAVRVVNFVMLVTPVPRTDSVPNTINVSQVDGKIQVTVNGVIDSTQPLATNLDRIVLYGSKSDDRITVDPSVTLPATINGGQGGTNSLEAGKVGSTLSGWFGQNTLTGGAGNDYLVGRNGRVRFRRSPGFDVNFAGIPHRPTTLHGPGLAPGGQFYRFVGNRLIPVAHPYFPEHRVKG